MIFIDLFVFDYNNDVFVVVELKIGSGFLDYDVYDGYLYMLINLKIFCIWDMVFNRVFL